ncbi:hypothetical protein K0T92_21275 [Paenibacillus oenotherae]|uniref:Uncharacterized protein n=1 Tax=Paenibacillus oenotherae TaxID=1435645 RepID=A0ABS7DBY3_9BACL|nr:hypothetical protein [Paenibacillus oenotherae]MBW7477253.1 hypothetical protein [Paenibacillus oenotherae]
MKLLIYLNTLTILRLRTVLTTSIYFISLSILHLIMILQYSASRYISIWDYLLLSVGGVLVNDTVIRLLVWIGVLLPVLIYLYCLPSVNGAYDIVLLTRSGSRFRWWTAKYMAIMIIISIYGVWYGIIHFITGSFFFSLQNDWGPLVKEEFIRIFQLQLSPASIIGLAMLLFVSGLLAFCTLGQSFAIFFRHSRAASVILTILLLAVYLCYSLKGLLFRELSPFHYPSFISVIQTGAHGLSAFAYFLCFNIFLSFACYLLGLAAIRRISFTGKNG